MKLYDHQQKSVDEIFTEFETHNKVLYQLPTGGGKTIVFSFITKQWVDTMNSRVAILCHRTELVEQTFKALNRINVTCSLVTKDTKKN